MACFKYDVELFLTDLKKVFQTNLNTKIDEINTEKQTVTPETSDNFAINRINPDAWFLNHIPLVWNYPQFVVWGIQQIDIERTQPDNAVQKVTAFIEICIPDEGEAYKESVIFKLLRYSRALQDIALKNFSSLRGYGSIQVESLSPTLVDISDKKLRMSGINISASFSLR